MQVITIVGAVESVLRDNVAGLRLKCANRGLGAIRLYISLAKCGKKFTTHRKVGGSQNMHAELIDVEQLLSKNYFKPARVQRQYIWSVSECETFHNDLVEAYKLGNDNDYYLGPIILGTEESQEAVWVYDGQQRLTTLTIYLAALGQVTSGALQSETAGLSRLSVRGEIRPRIDLRTRGGALTRVVRSTRLGRSSVTNMPVDWRILNIEKMFLSRLNEISDLDRFARWVQRHVVLNALWAKNDNGLTLFDRANNRGVRLEWYELVKSVLNDALGPKFWAQPGKRVDHFWYEQERETKREFPDLISSTAFIRYGEFDSALALAGFEEEFDTNRNAEQLTDAGNDLFLKMTSYARTSARLSNHHQFGKIIRTESDLIEFQLLALEYTQWKALLMYAEERGVSGKSKLMFLKRLRKLAYTAHLLGWPMWRTRLKDMFGGYGLENLKSRIDANRTMDVDLLTFIPEQLAQARGVLSSSMTDKSTYRPLVRLWESEQAFKRGILDGNAHFLSHIEHILPQAPRGDWCRAFPDEDERAEMRNRLGNFCLLSKDANYQLGNNEWTSKRKVFSKVPKYFVGAMTASKQADWTPHVVENRTQEMAADLIHLLGL